MYDETKRKRKIVKLAETPYFRWIRVSFNCNQLVQFGKVPRVRIPLSPTKDGRFRGGNHYAHEVDVIVEVSPEEVNASGRFGAKSFIKR